MCVFPNHNKLNSSETGTQKGKYKNREIKKFRNREIEKLKNAEMQKMRNSKIEKQNKNTKIQKSKVQI